MPYDPNANWTARTNASAKSPVYFVRIAGLTTKDFSTAPVRSASVTKKVLLKHPQTLGQKVNQLQGRTSMNLFSLELVNRDDEINDLFATEKASPTLPSLVNRRVTLFSGYADLAEADYAVWAVAQIRGVMSSGDGTLWRLTLQDLRRTQQETICVNADARGSSIELAFLSDTPAGVGVLRTTGDPTGWAQGDRLFLGPSTDAANLGAEEKVTVQQVRDVTNEVFIDPVTTYKFKAGDPVRTASTKLRGNPLNILLALLTGDFNNVSWPLLKAVGLPTGLGIASSDIDVTGIVKERDRVYPSAVWEFEINKPASGSSFLERNIYRWLGYPRILLNGKISFRGFRPVFPDDAPGLATIVENDVVSWSATREVELHVNRVVLGVDSAPAGGNASQIVTLEDTGDQGVTGEEAEIREESTGLRGADAGVRLAQGRGSVFLRRFVKPPYQVAMRVATRKAAIEVGEDVLLTHPRVPNPSSSLPGVTSRRMEVVERNENMSTGSLELILQDPNFTRPFFIGPAGGLPDYDSASSAEREYGYIAPSGGGNFSDGTPGYEIV